MAEGELGSNVIRLIRAFAGLTQAELAEELGTDQGSVSKWETDEEWGRPLPEKHVRKIAKVCRARMAETALRSALAATRQS
jgi:transcriptional regulator with XRE-family HTH domain